MYKVVVQEHSGEFWRNWCECIEAMGHECKSLNIRTPKGYREAIVADGVMWHIDMLPSMQSSANSILSSLECYGNKVVFPNRSTRWHFDNKVSQHYLMQALGVKTPDTYVFWDEDQALEFITGLENYPLIGKLSRGAGASGVFILRNKNDAFTYTKRAFSARGLSKKIGAVRYSQQYRLRKAWHNILRRVPRSILTQKHRNCAAIWDIWPTEKGYVYFQEFVHDNSYDTRITVIGNRAFAFQRENRKGDFRASGSGRINYEITGDCGKMIEISHDISNHCGFQSMAYDYLLDSKGEPLLVEMSYGFQSEAVYKCQGFWGRNMKWNEGHIRPEEAQAYDFMQDLKERKLCNL